MLKDNNAHSENKNYATEYADIIGTYIPSETPQYIAPQQRGYYPVTLNYEEVGEILKRFIAKQRQSYHQQGALFANIARSGDGVKTHELDNWGVASHNYHGYSMAINKKLAAAGINYRIRCMAPKAKVNGKTPSHMMWLVRKASAAECEAWGVSSDVIRDRDLWWDSFCKD